MLSMALSLSAKSMNSCFSFLLKYGRLLAIIVTLLGSSIIHQSPLFYFYFSFTADVQSMRVSFQIRLNC